ncbi:hypothetical protein ES703_81031 [subsurface metagenome]
MTIDKALGIMQQILDGTQPTSITDRRDAIKLGIEAMKLIQRERLLGINPVEKQLPGETKT